MAAYLLALYSPPADPAAFEAYYYGTHVPIAKKVPGLLSYTVNGGAIVNPAGASPYYLVAQLEFASMEALQAGLGSPEGRAAAGDTANFAQAGLVMLMMETKTI